MSAARKLAAFAAGLGLVFGLAAVAGGAVGPDRESSKPKNGADAAMGDSMSTHTASR